MTTALPANVTIIDLAVATSLTGAELVEAQFTVNSVATAKAVAMTTIAAYVGTSVIPLLPAQASHNFLSGPASGLSATPTFRPVVTADLPLITVPGGGTGTTTMSGVLLGAGAAALSVVAFTTAGFPFVSQGSLTAPAWTAIATNFVTGIFALAAGGLATNTLGVSGVVVGNDGSAPATVAATTLGSLFVSQGTTTNPAYTTTPVLNGFMTLNFTSAIPSAGSSTIGLRITSAAALGLFVGNGTPTLAAGTGSLYMRTDGTNATARLYSNTNGGSGWTSILATG